MDVTGNVIADYMRGNTRIVILDDAIEPEEEQELIYERVRGIITRSRLRRQKEKDAHPVESAASKLKPL